MEDKVTPGAFYGSALAALCGLALGLALHGPWASHPGGPQIWFSSAAAEELARPATDQDVAAATAPDEAPQQVADLDPGYVDPNPLPVTRLDPDRFNVEPAAAGEAEREDVDDQIDDGPRPPSTSND